MLSPSKLLPTKTYGTAVFGPVVKPPPHPSTKAAAPRVLEKVENAP